jgi:UDP-glucose 4-epimerase
VALAVRIAARRPGDAAALFADNARARRLLGFDARHSSLAEIVGSAWAWHTRAPAAPLRKPA